MTNLRKSIAILKRRKEVDMLSEIINGRVQIVFEDSEELAHRISKLMEVTRHSVEQKGEPSMEALTSTLYLSEVIMEGLEELNKLKNAN